MNPHIPRLALSVVGKPSFIRKRLEALREFGSNPFHPRRAIFAGLAVTLGIVAVMTVMFGKQKDYFAFEEGWEIQKDWQKEALEHNYNDSKFENGKMQFIRTGEANMVLTYPQFYLNGNLVYKNGGTSTYNDLATVFIDQQGLFVFSLKPFSDAKPIGAVWQNRIQFEINGLKMEIRSMYDIVTQKAFQGKPFPLFVKYDPHYDYGRFSVNAPEYQAAAEKWGGTESRYTYKPQLPFVQKMELDRIRQYALFSIKKYDSLYPNRPKPAVSFGFASLKLNGQAQKLIRPLVSQNLPQYDHDVFVFWNEDTGDGLFFSLFPFDGASKVAVVKGNTLTVQTPIGLFNLISSEDILLKKEGVLWFKFLPSKSKKPQTKNVASEMTFLVQRERMDQLNAQGLVETRETKFSASEQRVREFLKKKGVTEQNADAETLKQAIQYGYQ